MTDPTYTITLTESERTAMAKVLGAFVTKLINAPLQVDAPNSKSGTDTARAILSPPAPLPAVATAPILPPTVEPRDRWGTDRAGNPWKATSKGVSAIDVHIWKNEQAENFLRVTWQNQGAGHGNANCFDQELWPWLIKQAGQQTRLYVTKRGNYINIVGVRA